VTSPDQTVNQDVYIETLEEDLVRETRARRLLTALLAQRTRTLQTYVERFGDITAPDQAAPDPAPAPTPEAPVG
jgi:hypothetical protein